MEKRIINKYDYKNKVLYVYEGTKLVETKKKFRLTPSTDFSILFDVMCYEIAMGRTLQSLIQSVDWLPPLSLIEQQMREDKSLHEKYKSALNARNILSAEVLYANFLTKLDSLKDSKTTDLKTLIESLMKLVTIQQQEYGDNLAGPTGDSFFSRAKPNENKNT